MRLRFIVLAALFWLFQLGLSAQEKPSAAARIGVKTAADLSSRLAAIDTMTANQFANGLWTLIVFRSHSITEQAA